MFICSTTKSNNLANFEAQDLWFYFLQNLVSWLFFQPVNEIFSLVCQLYFTHIHDLLPSTRKYIPSFVFFSFQVPFCKRATVFDVLSPVVRYSPSTSFHSANTKCTWIKHIGMFWECQSSTTIFLIWLLMQGDSLGYFSTYLFPLIKDVRLWLGRKNKGAFSKW